LWLYLIRSEKTHLPTVVAMIPCVRYNGQEIMNQNSYIDKFITMPSGGVPWGNFIWIEILIGLLSVVAK
jgi:hypothetical protein